VLPCVHRDEEKESFAEAAVDEE